MYDTRAVLNNMQQVLENIRPLGTKEPYVENNSQKNIGNTLVKASPNYLINIDQNYGESLRRICATMTVTKALKQVKGRLEEHYKVPHAYVPRPLLRLNYTTHIRIPYAFA